MLFRNLAFIAAVCCVEVGFSLGRGVYGCYTDITTQAASLRKIMPRFTKVTAEEAWAGMNPGWNVSSTAPDTVHSN